MTSYLEAVHVFVEAMRHPVVAGFTSAELHAMRRVAQGETNFAIAADAGVSVKTVKKRLTAVYRRLGAVDRASAVARMDDVAPGWRT